MRYEMTFKAPSGRIFTVIASNDTLHDLVRGYHPGCGRPARAHGELKGVSIRFPGRRKPPFVEKPGTPDTVTVVGTKIVEGAA